MIKNNRKIFIITTVFIVLGLIGVLIWVLSQSKLEGNNPRINFTQDTQEAPEVQEVYLTIDFGDRKISYTSQFKSQETVFEILKEACKNNGLEIRYRNYNTGVLVEQIGEKKNGEGGKYWMFYLNNKLADKACNKIYLNPSDEIEFKFEKPSF